MSDDGSNDVRLAELLAALSLATDLGNGMPLERTMRTGLLAVGVGRHLGLADRDVSNTFYLALLRAIGCTAFAHEEAMAYGDDITYRRTYFPVDFGREEEVVAATRENLAQGQEPDMRERAIARFFADGPRLASEMAATACSVAVRFASRLGMDAIVGRGLTQIWERWDGGGFPEGLAEGDIEISARLVQLANVVEIDLRTGGRRVASENVTRRSRGVVRSRSGRRVLDCASDLFDDIERESVWEAVLDAEPLPHVYLPVSRAPRDRALALASQPQPEDLFDPDHRNLPEPHGHLQLDAFGGPYLTIAAGTRISRGWSLVCGHEVVPSLWQERLQVVPSLWQATPVKGCDVDCGTRRISPPTYKAKKERGLLGFPWVLLRDLRTR